MPGLNQFGFGTRSGWTMWMLDGSRTVAAGQHMGNSVQGRKSLVNRDLQNRRRRIERGVNRSHAAAVPTTTGAECPLAAVPDRSEDCLIQTPRYQLASAERWRQRDHV